MRAWIPLILALALAAPCRSGQAALKVEHDPASLALLTKTCTETSAWAKRSQSLDSANKLLVCLSHPDPEIRWLALGALNTKGYYKRPDFEQAILPLLQQAYQSTYNDPDGDVRIAAGWIKIYLQQWKDYDSPRHNG